MKDGSQDTSNDPVGAERFVGRALTASLTVNDVQASIAWYRDVVGFVVDNVYENAGTVRAASLRAGDVRILIGQDNGAKGWDRVKGQGMSLQIITDQDVDQLAERMVGLGVTLDTELTVTPWGARIFRFCDPDGFRFTISTEPANNQR